VRAGALPGPPPQRQPDRDHARMARVPADPPAAAAPEPAQRRVVQGQPVVRGRGVADTARAGGWIVAERRSPPRCRSDVSRELSIASLGRRVATYVAPTSRVSLPYPEKWT